MLGGASSSIGVFRYLRCIECERTWRDEYRMNFPPASGTICLGQRIHQLDEVARNACYRPSE